MDGYPEPQASEDYGFDWPEHSWQEIMATGEETAGLWGFPRFDNCNIDSERRFYR